MPTQVELSNPVQLVADVTRMAELRAFDTGFYGFFPLNADNVHPGADTQEATISPYATELANFFAGGSGVPSGVCLWLTHFGCQLDNNNITSAVLSMNTPVPFSQGWAARNYLIGHWNSQVTAQAAAGPGNALTQVGLNTVGPATGVRCQLPFPVPPESTFTWRTISSGANTIRISMQLYITPIGVLPPTVQ